MRQRFQSVQLDSDLNSLHEVERFIEQISDDYNINHSFFGNILLAVTEAFRNAVLHGSANSSSKKVMLEFKSDRGNMIFSVSDDGFGFDFNALPDPTVSTSDGQQRGLFLIKSLSDSVVFSDGGRRIEMCFAVERSNKDLANDRASRIAVQTNALKPDETNVKHE